MTSSYNKINLKIMFSTRKSSDGKKHTTVFKRELPFSPARLVVLTGVTIVAILYCLSPTRKVFNSFPYSWLTQTLAVKKFSWLPVAVNIAIVPVWTKVLAAIAQLTFVGAGLGFFALGIDSLL